MSNDGIEQRYSRDQIVEAALRASYRGILGREPEPAVLAELTTPPLPQDVERELAEIARRAVDSPEFSMKLGASRFGNGTWVIGEVEPGLLLWLDLGDLGVSRPCLAGVYEPDETLFLQRLTKPGMTFVDIGANIGWFTMHAAQWVGPGGRVISFEPREKTFERLGRSVAINGFDAWVECHNLALMEASGTAFIGCDERVGNPGGTWTLSSERLQDDFRAQRLSVQQVGKSTLDIVLGGRRVDVIKIDIEGAEPIALSGAVETLRTSRPTIVSEISFDGLAIVAESSPREFIQWMGSHGYDCNLIDGSEMGAPYDGGDLPGGRRLTNVVFSPRAS